MTNTVKPSRQEMIEEIYEKIADKTLGFGCRIILENQEIIMETNPYEGHYSEYYEANGVITWRYWTETTEWTTLQIEKIYFYEKFYNEKEVSDAFAEEFVFDEKYETENKNLTIIWHPVMIGDVMDYFEKNNFTKFKRILWIIWNNVNFDQSLAMLWLEKRKPIEEQSDDCIDFIYNLIFE